jgi:hypothetical protein
MSDRVERGLAGTIGILIAVDANHSRARRQQSVGASSLGARLLRALLGEETFVTAP